jgi:hypothetical protein
MAVDFKDSLNPYLSTMISMAIADMRDSNAIMATVIFLPKNFAIIP